MLVPPVKRQSKVKQIIKVGPYEGVDPWSKGVETLRALDPRWKYIIDEIGPCRLEPRTDRFGTLVRAIVGQQISSKAASSIDRRLRMLTGEPHTPEPILNTGEAGLRSCGLSGVKARYVLNLAKAVHEEAIPLESMHEWDDEQVISALTTVKGVGPWTAEMFLIFGLGRLDVLSVGDLGIRVGLKNFHELEVLPDASQCRLLAEPWRPFRTIAMWYLWQQIDNPKRS
ncbi:DNA-3-methyladenine glycosylase family protein [Tundrisphaera lichenicola]|uniref:DNA-3-methyladenine glycosylase family protein n=1 Tax=Tundrisphaera lichenicola TaxID=2029860 RepID=UPI003EC08D28